MLEKHKIIFAYGYIMLISETILILRVNIFEMLCIKCHVNFMRDLDSVLYFQNAKMIMVNFDNMIPEIFLKHVIKIWTFTKATEQEVIILHKKFLFQLIKC